MSEIVKTNYKFTITKPINTLDLFTPLRFEVDESSVNHVVSIEFYSKMAKENKDKPVPQTKHYPPEIDPCTGTTVVIHHFIVLKSSNPKFVLSTNDAYNATVIRCYLNCKRLEYSEEKISK